MAHTHEHSHAEQNLSTAFWLNFLFSIIEFGVGIWSNSSAVMADAVHDFGDSMSIAFSWLMQKLSGKSRTRNFSYGYRRFSLLAALVNALILIGGMVYVLVQALPRLIQPEVVRADGMAVLGAATILINYLAYRRVNKGKTLNEKTISWHLLEDILGGVMLLVVSVTMMFYPLYILDPILSIVFSLFILYNIMSLFLKTAKVFLQSIPEGFDIDKMRTELEATPGVNSIHDMHLWSLDGEYHVLTAHLVIESGLSLSKALELKCKIKEKIHEAHIDHATIEIEREGENCDFLEC